MCDGVVVLVCRSSSVWCVGVAIVWLRWVVSGVVCRSS